MKTKLSLLFWDCDRYNTSRAAGINFVDFFFFLFCGWVTVEYVCRRRKRTLAFQVHIVQGERERSLPLLYHPTKLSSKSLKLVVVVYGNQKLYRVVVVVYTILHSLIFMARFVTTSKAKRDRRQQRLRGGGGIFVESVVVVMGCSGGRAIQ